MSRVILDTHVVFAAFATRGLCESVFELCLERHDLFVSDHLIGELKEKLKSKLRLPTSTVTAIVDLYKTRSSSAPPEEMPEDACRDPDDIPVLGLAMSVNADYLVTGDKDLLSLKTIGDTRIVTHRAFYESAEH